MKHLNTLTKTIDAKVSIPMLHNILVKDGKAYATDMDILTTITTAAPEGVYNHKEFKAGVYNDIGSPENYPIFETQEYKAGIELPVQDFITALQFVEFAQSKEATRYYICGTFFNIDASELVATDGHRAVLHPLNGLQGLAYDGLMQHGAGRGFILPSKAVALLLSIKKPTGNIKISINDRFVKFEIDGVEVISKVIDGKYPDYKRIIPNIGDDAIKTVIYGKQFKAAYKIANSMREKKNMPLTPQGFRYKPDAFYSVAEGLFNNLQTGFNCKYLLDMVNLCGDLHFESNHVNDPYLMNFANGAKLILMPMRV